MFSRTSKADKGKVKEKAVETSAFSEESTPNPNTSSPSESRKSRDTHSIHTQNSVADSHESLGLERTSSNTPSEITTPSGTSTKEKESSFRQLLRKGSSSKFSFSSIRGKDSGLFSGKKGGNSAANSDRNASVEREGSFDEYSEDAGFGRNVDSITSSPMIGSVGDGKGKEREGTPKEGRMSVNWGRAFGIKKGKGRESMDVEGSEVERIGTEDEGGT
jgi:hypothetical protein